MAAPEAYDQKLADERWTLLFGVQRSVRYHARRRRHFDRIHRFTTLVALIFGSATFAAIFGELGGRATVLAFAGLVTVMSALDLVIGSAMRARDHHDFERRWIDLERQLVRAGDYDRDDLARFTEQRLSIEAEEEPPLRVLDLLCHNELMRAQDRTDDLYRIGLIQRAFSQWFDFMPDSIERADPA